MIRRLFGLISVIIISILICGCSPGKSTPLGMAVEFNDHAACAYIALDQGWYKDAGIEVEAYESYVTGVALAAALTRGDIQVAYMCLVPAIVAYKNGGVPLKIVCGTHKYGYGLVVNSSRIIDVTDLEKPGMRIGCVNEGAATDIVLHKTIDKFKLNRENVLKNMQRMNPSKQLLALESGQLDAVFVPEHWATAAENMGFRMLSRSQDVWLGMQGSVLAVKSALIEKDPRTVKKLVDVSRNATDWINANQSAAAIVLCQNLTGTQGVILPQEASQTLNQFELSPEMLLRSFSNLEYNSELDPVIVQNTINYLVSLGYLEASFNASEILDLRFIEHE